MLKCQGVRENKITCPTCGKDIDRDQTLEFISKEDEHKLTKLGTQLLVDRDPCLHWCPSPDGELGYVKFDHEDIDKPTLGEGSGGFKFGLRCYERWENQHSCKSNIKKNYGKVIDETEVKNGPKCKTVIEKTEGCLHMTGYICKYEFGWAGGKKYTSSHLDGPLNTGEADGDYLCIKKFAIILLLPLQLIFWPTAFGMDIHEGEREGTGWHTFFYWKGLHIPVIEIIYLMIIMTILLTVGIALVAFCPLLCIPLCGKMIFGTKRRKIINQYED